MADDAFARIDCEYLEWLSAISPEHERRLRNLAENPRTDELQREQLEWLAAISPEHARQLRDLRREEASAAEVRERSRRIVERLERAAEGLRLVYRAPHFKTDVNTGYDISK